MAHPYMHALSSAKKFGGVPEDYIDVHNWFDQTKSHLPDLRHRAILHSSFGIFLCEQVFGSTIKRKSDGKTIPLRPIGEQHVVEDLGHIPTIQDWVGDLPLKDWMIRGAKSLRELANTPVESKSSPNDSV
jgi:hypothetical protein